MQARSAQHLTPRAGATITPLYGAREGRAREVKHSSHGHRATKKLVTPPSKQSLTLMPPFLHDRYKGTPEETMDG